MFQIYNDCLPLALFQAMGKYLYEYKRVAKYSTTMLCRPVQILILERRYSERIRIPASDLLWMFLGTAIHEKIASYDFGEGFVEEQFVSNFGPYEVGGKPDLLRGRQDGKTFNIRDYKFVSVFAWKYGAKSEWEWQGNINAYHSAQSWFPVSKISVDLIFRDWRKRMFLQALEKHNKEIEAGNDSQMLYPRPVEHFDVPVLDHELVERYVVNRCALIDAQNMVPDYDLVPCTLEDKWEKEPCFAVKKAAGKRALPGGIHETKDDAEEFIIEWTRKFQEKNPKKSVPAIEIEHRPGERTRCELYCNVRPFCAQYKRESAARGIDQEGGD